MSLRTVEAQLVASFRDGDHALFFTVWGNHVPETMRNNDPSIQRLEFLLNVYFAVYSLIYGPKASKTSPSPESAMETFKKFIETRGASLSKTTQFLPYYALPYVPDPRTHPSYRDVFGEGWVEGLEDRLKKFLARSVIDKMRHDVMASASDAQAIEMQRYTQEIKLLKQSLRDREFSEDHVRKKLRQLQLDYHNLITIASELVQTLASCINGEKITPTYLSSIVQRLSAFKRSNQEHRAQDLADDAKVARSKPPPAPLPSSGMVTADKTWSGTRPNDRFDGKSSHGAPHQSRMQQIPVEQRLDYGAVSRLWQSDSNDSTVERQQALLLQAFRLRLVRAPSGMARRAILHSLISADFLGIRHGKNIVPAMLDGASPMVKDQLARLINVVATDCAGREYILCRGADSVVQLVTAMMKEKADTECRQNVLGALQKLSLRRIAQSAMNHQKTITYMQTAIFSDIDTLSEYTIEYGTALMMNLCLRTLGKQECASNPDRTLKTLNELIEHDNIQVKTYVNGTLYSILSEPEIREKARGIGMEEQLKYLRQVSDEQLIKQIDFVIEKLASEEDDEISDAVSEDGEEDDNIDDEDDLPVFEDEDSEDISPSAPGELGGDALLETYSFTKPGISAAIIRTGTDTDMNRMRGSHASINTAADFRKAVTPSRPTTPSVVRKSSIVSQVSATELAQNDAMRGGGLARASIENSVNGATPNLAMRTVAEGDEMSVGLDRLQRTDLDMVSGGRRSSGKSQSPAASMQRNENHELDLAFSARPKIARTPVPENMQ